MKPSEAIKLLGKDSYQVTKEVHSGYKMIIGFTTLNAAKQYIANMDDSSNVFIMVTTIKDIIV